MINNTTSNNISVKIENVNVKFGTHSALKNINFELEQGNFLSVVGPNGSGKSTLIKVILGLVKPTDGYVWIFGNLLQNSEKNVFGYVPQIKTLDRSFPAKSIELVASGLTGKWISKIDTDLKEKSLFALEEVAAVNLADRQLNTLSGGELQRIYLARSFIRNPKILLMDEPATGIDSAGEKDLNRIIEEYRLKKKTTVVMVTHDWESAFHHSDYVLMLDSRQICFEKPDIAFCDEFIRTAFGHVGHNHTIKFGGKQ